MAVFVDTNVLLYAVSTVSGEKKKSGTARAILARDDLVLSAQVLQEFYVQSTRESRPGALSHQEATSFVESLQRFRVQAVTMGVLREAFAIRERFLLSYWDSAILAAARTCGCDAVYSEDLNPDQDYGGLRVINPFAAIT